MYFPLQIVAQFLMELCGRHMDIYLCAGVHANTIYIREAGK